MNLHAKRPLGVKVSEAKAKLLVEYPYFGTLASRLKLVQNDNIGTFLSDGERLEYNDEYLESLSLSELEFALANAAMHTVLAHKNRKNSRYGWLWQLSTDYAINAMLMQNGLDMPLGVNYENRFEGLYAEEIYEILKDEIKNEEFSDDESDETGFNENEKRQNNRSNSSTQNSSDANKPQMEVENSANEELLSQMNEKLLQDEMQRGELPLGLERFFDLTCKSKIDWREELAWAIDRFYRDNYTTLPPSKKLLYLGTYLPSLTSENIKLTIAIDSSGSVNEELLSSFMSEVNSIMLHHANYEIDLLVADAKVHSHEKFYAGDMLTCKLKGGGGTDFRRVFEYVEQNLYDTSLLLYFTDLDGIFPKSEPFYEVLWISPKESQTPFGRVVVID